MSGVVASRRATPSEEDMAKVQRIIELHDEAFRHYRATGGDCWKSSEGAITLTSGTVFDREAADNGWVVEVYSYVFGSGRTHYFNSVDDALAAVTEWHREEMSVRNHDNPWGDF